MSAILLDAVRLLPINPAVADRLRQRPNASVVHADGPGYPCRQCLRDAEPGEAMVLVSHDPFDGTSPYTGPTAIYLHREPCRPYTADGRVPGMLRSRRLSLRAFDRRHHMRAAEVVDGPELAAALARVLASESVDYVQIHNAGAGCWNCRAVRA